MASAPRVTGVSLPERRVSKQKQKQKQPGAEQTIVSKLTNSELVGKGKKAACDAVFVGKKLLRSTGKAAWIAGTTFLVLVVPLIIEMDREQQLSEIEIQQQSLLGAPPGM